jgi:hypothetical protein
MKGLLSAVAVGVFTALSLLPISSAGAQRVVSTPAGDVRYMNGGIGEEQADLMRQMSTEFPVRFTFSRHNPEHNTDEFVADVRLRITDSGGRTLLDLLGQGPIFLLSLPNGTYTVDAEHGGQVKTRRFQVTDRRQEIGFSWPG